MSIAKKTALVYCENQFGLMDGKTVAGLVKHSETYNVVGVIESSNESLFRWIKSTGRFMPSHSERFHDDMMTNKLEELLDQEEELDEEE